MRLSSRTIMKIVYFGTPEFALNPLESLLKEEKNEILAVVTQPDKAQGRKKILTPSPIKRLAKLRNLKVIQPKNKKELKSELEKLERADFFVVIAFGMILSKNVLDMPKFGSINVHASLLPKYRGASPIQESLLHGDNETGISIMQIDEELDHGNIFLIRRLSINAEDNFGTLSSKLSGLATNILPHVLSDIADGNLKAISQNHAKASYCHKINKEDGKIDFFTSAQEIRNKIRAYTPWPGVYTTLKDKKLKIITSNVESEENLSPGEFKIENKILKIGTKKGVLLPKTLQLEGKKVMDVKSFINGYQSLINK